MNTQCVAAALLTALLLIAGILYAAPFTHSTQALHTAAIHINWNPHTLSLVQAHATYGRMIRLQDDSILCSYESAGGSWVRNSATNGQTWQDPILVNRIPYANSANPEILQLNDGQILLFYNQRPHDGIHPFAIGCCSSSDSGATWRNPGHLIYEASPHPQNGCWEPAAIQLPSGEIQLFFANEFPHKNSSDQEITLMRSFDNGATWSRPQTASYRAGHRDGMPVPLLLQDNKGIILAIEDNGLTPDTKFKPAIIHSTLEENWKQPVTGDSPERWAAIASPWTSAVYAGAPYIRQLPTGETVLSCQSDEGRQKPQMVVYIGGNHARNFSHRSAPFPIPSHTGGWWNSLFIKDPSTVTAISETTINGMSGLWTVDGRIIR